MSRRVGPTYTPHVGKGGNAVRSGLGIPSDGPLQLPGRPRRHTERPRRRADLAEFIG